MDDAELVAQGATAAFSLSCDNSAGQSRQQSLGTLRDHRSGGAMLFSLRTAARTYSLTSCSLLLDRVASLVTSLSCSSTSGRIAKQCAMRHRGAGTPLPSAPIPTRTLLQLLCSSSMVVNRLDQSYNVVEPSKATSIQNKVRLNWARKGLMCS